MDRGQHFLNENESFNIGTSLAGNQSTQTDQRIADRVPFANNDLNVKSRRNGFRAVERDDENLFRLQQVARYFRIELRDRNGGIPRAGDGTLDGHFRNRIVRRHQRKYGIDHNVSVHFASVDVDDGAVEVFVVRLDDHPDPAAEHLSGALNTDVHIVDPEQIASREVGPVQVGHHLIVLEFVRLRTEVNVRRRRARQIVDGDRVAVSFEAGERRAVLQIGHF